MTPEGRIKAEVLRALGRREDLLIWNNPSGMALSLDGSRKIMFGLPGSADLIGVKRVLVTADMVGQKIGIALAIETKSPGRVATPQQMRFARRFRDCGGVYILTTTAEGIEGVLP